MSGEVEADRGPGYHTVIRPRPVLGSLGGRELWRYRGLLGAFTRRDLTLRYRQTLLGPTWVVVQPILAAGIFSFVFGSVAKLRTDGVPYFLFSFVGMVGYNAFSNTLNAVSQCLIVNSSLVGKVYFPRLTLAISQVGSRLADVTVSTAVFFLLTAFFHVDYSWRMLTLPVWVALVFALALGPGLLAGAANVSYRDVGYIVPVLLPLLLYLSPVAYPASDVPHSLHLAYAVNPLVGVIDALRWCLLDRGHLPGAEVGYSVAASVVLLAIGVVYYRAHERRFADDI